MGVQKRTLLKATVPSVLRSNNKTPRGFLISSFASNIYLEIAIKEQN